MPRVCEEHGLSGKKYNKLCNQIGWKLGKYIDIFLHLKLLEVVDEDIGQPQIVHKIKVNCQPVGSGVGKLSTNQDKTRKGNLAKNKMDFVWTMKSIFLYKGGSLSR